MENNSRVFSKIAVIVLHVQVHDRTSRKRLNKYGWCRTSVRRKSLLNKKNTEARLEFAKLCLNKPQDFWNKDMVETLEQISENRSNWLITQSIAEPHGTGAQQPTQRPQTRQDGGSGRTSSGNAWSRGAPSFASNSSYTGQAFRRRNVVRFRHGGAKEDLPDRRFVVRELLCTQMGFVPTDILAVINLPDRQGYDVSFKLMSDLDRFWANLTRLRDTEGWDKFSFIPISRPDTASVTIVFWNEAVPPQDIVIWLRRHCDLMSDLSKNRDEDGVWTGGWRVLVKLRQQNNITQHLPNSFFIGREKGICFYAGQPRRCFKCGKAGHVASVCSMVKCSLCNEMGHVSATCQNIRCNLCGRIGHPHRDCPDAWHNIYINIF
ncbi:uncharacterized protein RB166_001698 [Leptodactylus fuscus]